MKKYMDKLKSKIHVNKNLFVFLLVIVIVGLVSGSIFSMIIDSNDKKLVFDYLSDFFNNIKDNKLSYDNTVINTFIFTIGLAILIWILGISVIGFFLIIFILFLKSFVVGFAVSSIIMNFKLKGVLLSLIYIFPHQVINVLVFMLISAYGLIVSFKLIKCMGGKLKLDFKNIMNRYLIVLIFSLVILMFSSFYEVYILPRVLSFVLKL